MLVQIDKPPVGCAVTVTLAVPCAAPDVAVTVNGPPTVVPAVNTPLVEIVPPPLTDQLTGADGMLLPN